MTFAWPHLFWLLLVPAAWLVWDLTRHRRGGALAGHPKIAMAEAGARQVALARPRIANGRARPWLCAGLVFAIAALARPQWGRLDEPVFDQAREILIAMDLSRSMLTPDVKPSRLERAKLLTQSLLEKLSGERVGLVVFSGTAFLQSPLSADYEILREFLPALGPDFLPEGGTNYRALIDTSLAAFSSTTAADRFLIILSDGEATEDNWRDRIAELKAKGVRVIALGVGTTTGAMIPDGAGGFVKDERGAVVLSKLESSTLRELATKTGGVYQDASSWVDLASIIQATVNAAQKGQFTEKNTVRLVERFQWPLAIALWCLLVSAYYELPVRPRPREVKLRVASGAGGPSGPGKVANPSTAAAAALLLFVVLGPWTSFSPVCAQPSTPPPAGPVTPSATPVLSQIVGRLAEADERTPRDWAEFGRETVTWGNRLQANQQKVPEGPVRDALRAVDLGEKADVKTTDWPKLRSDLEALLQRPDEQKQQQQKQDQQNQQDQKNDQQNQSQDQQQKQQQQQQQQQSQQNQQRQPQDASKKQQQENGQPKPQEQQQQEKKDSAFGDMKDRQQPPPPPQEMQKVGGVHDQKTAEKPPSDPALALPLQKLQQLRNNDSPAELFKLMEAEKDQKPHKPTKDW